MTEEKSEQVEAVARALASLHGATVVGKWHGAPLTVARLRSRARRRRRLCSQPLGGVRVGGAFCARLQGPRKMSRIPTLASFLKQSKRAAREAELGARQRALPDRRYGVTESWPRKPSEEALAVGKAAEHLVCADALMRGYEAFLAAQGAPYDLVIEKDGRLFKVHVKATQRAVNVNASGLNPRMAYSFSVRRRGKNGDQRLSAEDADIVALVALDRGVIAYMPTGSCSSTVQLEPCEVPSNGYVRAYLKPVSGYPLEEAVASLVSIEAYVDLKRTYPPFPDASFGVLYVDPPWSFTTYSENGMDRSADNHYPTVPTDILRAVGPYVPSADDCMLFLWATAPMLPEALSVMKDWGFQYKSHFVWVKDLTGTGYWARNKHELLLVGTRGSVPAPAMGTQEASVICAPRGRHSEKPEVFLRLIERHFPTLPKLEMFSRRWTPGWSVWGLEV